MTSISLRPDRTLVAVVVVMAVAALPLALSAAWLLPVLLVPAAVLVWVLRARVDADATRLVVCNGLARQSVRWDEVSGFQVPDRGPVRLLRQQGKPLPLTALSRRDLPRLMEVSQPS